MTDASPALRGDSELRDALFDGRCGDPHALLGAHPAQLDGRDGIVVRAHHPGAAEMELLLDKKAHKSMQRVDERGLFACFVDGASFPLRYELAVKFEDRDEPWKTVDPYRFPPVLGDLDLHLHGEGRHYRVYERLGAHPRELDGVAGTSFAVWAPNASRVSVVGDFNDWDGRRHPMRQMGASGIWELFVPGVGRGAIYKYEMRLPSGDLRIKTDPVAMRMEMRPATGSVVWGLDDYQWSDDEWLERRARTDARRAPMSIYEVHLGSWMRDGEGNWLGYREIADRLLVHCQEHGFTHVELMPVAEHAFDPSWGYQTTGYYAPTCRFGDPDDLRYFVDKLHQAHIGVLLDWVPAHFPRDDYSLRQFDGTALYEHADPRQGEHRDWGTLIFNYGRNEVRSFLISNAIYWLEEFHFDGLRVDAVASMIYLDYSRDDGDWVPNEYGGRENLHAISFLQELNTVVYRDVPGAVTIAEESTAWAGVTLPTYLGGLGFGFKWNMGWMHDTLEYFSKEAVHRSYHQNNLTFSMLYAYTENFVLPLSHDEVVHLKGSLWGKMPGDDWQKAANLRLLLTYQMGSCGKKLLYMGGEYGQTREWNHDFSLDWHEAGEPLHAGVQQLSKDLGRLYVENDALWAWDVDPEGFSWIDCNDNAHSVLSFIRRGPSGYLVFVFNFTPVPREGYRVGLPEGRRYIERVNTDAGGYGGGNIGNGGELHSEQVPWHGLGFSAALTIPPLGALILQPG